MNHFSGLKDNGYAEVKYPADLRRAVEEAAQKWENFCTLPNEVKLSFEYKDTGRTDSAGYELKESSGSTVDQKENFHYTKNEGQRLAKVEVPGESHPIVREFLNSADQILDAVTPTIEAFAKDLEENGKMENFSNEVMDSRDKWILRFLHYFPSNEENASIASPHPDRSGFTLHLYQDLGGLEYYWNDKWEKLPLSEESTIILGGMQLQFRSKSQILAAYHQVVANKEAMQNGRFSAVLFIPLIDTPNYDKQKKGRLQDQEIGFNYNLPMEKLEEYFFKP